MASFFFKFKEEICCNMYIYMYKYETKIFATVIHMKSLKAYVQRYLYWVDLATLVNVSWAQTFKLKCHTVNGL
jgi:hypothetical protein